ncbi:hypothetical protein NPIL_422491 [Nephila pilipes]|uniref:Uncharacterized protein n=1 Tax=Nephila pilipes TaxID=299642 RepID=A0A8X6Q7N1_NEPPI|nr:hypothetical protein NPIL_422491 [Nephila pilipes]
MRCYGNIGLTSRCPTEAVSWMFEVRSVFFAALPFTSVRGSWGQGSSTNTIRVNKRVHLFFLTPPVFLLRFERSICGQEAASFSGRIMTFLSAPGIRCT